MRRLVLAAAALFAGGALAQTTPNPAEAPTPAPTAESSPAAPPTGSPISIDPRGFNGGSGVNPFNGVGGVILDPLAGLAVQTTPVGPQLPPDPSAAVQASTPPTLDPSPTREAYPFCRNRNDPACRSRGGNPVVP